jgi:hypothetical protein
MAASVDQWCLRDLPLPTRVVIATFLIAVGAGYAAALVQLHFQRASPGESLPGPAEVTQTYAGQGKPTSQVERLLVSTTGNMNAQGTMRPAFLEQSRNWEAISAGKSSEELRQLREEREGERLALLSWVRQGAKKENYDSDNFTLGEELSRQEITPAFLIPDAKTGQPAAPRHVRIRSLIEQRCVDCHHETTGRHQLARLVPLNSYERLEPHCRIATDKQLALPKLAQTSHVHLLGFAGLYGAIGVVFSFTSYPRTLRLLLGPVPLVLQMVDISCWWLARWNGAFAWVIYLAGLGAGIFVALQLAGCLWDLFGRWGRAVLVGLALTACVVGGVVKVCVVNPQLEQEKVQAREHQP